MVRKKDIPANRKNLSLQGRQSTPRPSVALGHKLCYTTIHTRPAPKRRRDGGKGDGRCEDHPAGLVPGRVLDGGGRSLCKFSRTGSDGERRRGKWAEICGCAAVPGHGGLQRPPGRGGADGRRPGADGGGRPVPADAGPVVRPGHRPVRGGAAALSPPAVPVGWADAAPPAAAAGGGAAAGRVGRRGDDAAERPRPGVLLPAAGQHGTSAAPRGRLFGAGLALFACCDLCVGLYNLAGAVPPAAYAFARVGMWLFYLPSQVLIVCSGFPERKETR